MPIWGERRQLLLLAAAVVLLVAGVTAGHLAQARQQQALVYHVAVDLPDGAPIRVEVAGSVTHPGVYDLTAGDRIADALVAAGGATAGADLTALNQARRLRDEEQIVVPGPRTATSGAPASLGGPIDINSASMAQLDVLPGIGEAYARRIVDSRAVDGPFAAVEDLVSRRVVPASTFNQIRALITAGRP